MQISETALFAGGAIVLQAVATLPMPIERRLPSLNLTDLRLRLQSWILVTGIFALALDVTTGIAVGLLSFVAFHILKTYYSTIPLRFADRRAMLLSYLLIPIHQIVAYNGHSFWINWALLALPVLWLALIDRGDGWGESVAKLLWGIVPSSVVLGYIARFAADSAQFHPISISLLLFAYVAIFMTISTQIWNEQ